MRVQGGVGTARGDMDGTVLRDLSHVAATDTTRLPPVTALSDDLALTGLLPVKVVPVDIEQLPSEISAVHAGGGLYRGLWMLVRRGGEPVRLVSVPLSGESISRAEIERHLADPELWGGAPDRFALGAAPVRISVVVCSTLDREDYLAEALASITALTYPDFEVLVVDNSPDARAARLPWLERLDRVRVLREPRPGLSAARNCGLRAASGTLIAFTDDDVVVDDGWLHALARRFDKHPEDACVAGLILPKDVETPAQAMFERYYDGMSPRALSAASYRLECFPRTRALSKATVRETDDAGHVVARFSVYGVGKFGAGANMAFRTSVLRDNGGFNVTLGAGTPTAGGEDIGVFARLAWRGYGMAFEPAALVFHRHREDDRSLRRQIEAYGLGFVAMLLALVAEDRRHLGALLATTPTAARAIVGSFTRKLRIRDGGAESSEATVSELARIELRGMAKGPAAYLRSRRSARRLDARAAP